MEWIPNGSGLILTGGSQGNNQIYFLSYSNGDITPITNDFNSYTMASLSNDSKFIAATQENLHSTIWTAPAKNLEALTPVTSGSTVIDGALGLSWTPDGHIL